MTATLEGIINRLDGMSQQLALLHLRQTELENQIRSSKKLWAMLIDREEELRPEEAAAPNPNMRRAARAETERCPTDDELQAIESEDLVPGL